MVDAMTPRERVIAALENRQPDGVPRYMGGIFVSGINIVAYKNLIRYLELDEQATIIIDGPIVWHLDDLIEIGVDSLNSVDVGAKDMEDTASLKARFGERISSWDRIETSRELLFGTLEDVHAEVRRRVGDLHHNGGDVLASVYNFLAEVPPENICPIRETVDLLE
jgi:uroporphyrinogen decarboxylase